MSADFLPSARRIGLFLAVGAMLTGACSSPTAEDGSADPEFRHLEPYPNHFRRQSELYSPQPRRAKPRAVLFSPRRDRLYAALQGAIDEPGESVVELDPASRQVTRRFRVGHSPTGLAIHPTAPFLVVTNRYSNFVSVVDLRDGRTRRFPADFYQIEAAFSPDGRWLYTTNRWRDSVQRWRVSLSGGRGGLKLRRAPSDQHPHGVPVGTNPEDLVVSDDGQRVFVTAPTHLTVSEIDAQKWREVDRDADPSTTDFGAPEGISRLDVDAPPYGLAVTGEYVYVPTLGKGSFHPADAGPDTDNDGHPGDGTPNEGFNDLQNDLAVYRRPRLQPVARYTSDSLCCPEVGDVEPEEPGGALLPPESVRIVAGALPDDAVTWRHEGSRFLLVAYSGSNEVQRFEIADDGTLRAGPVSEVGFQPVDLTVDPDRDQLWVCNRLGESVSVVDLPSFQTLHEVVVGDVSEGAFPATDAEIGELYFFSGAAFSVDADQTCAHCHPERGNIAKPFALPLLADSRGSRMPPDTRGLFRTRPWLFEGAFDETNIFEAITEFTPAANFCCNAYRRQPDADPERIARCAEDPPAFCRGRPHPRDVPTRDRFLKQQARRLMDRDHSFGDAVDAPVDFIGLTRLVGLFLIHEPGLFPNPNAAAVAGDGDSTDRDIAHGRELFNSAATGCAPCHPSPTFAVSYGHNPFRTPLTFGPLITPTLGPDGQNLDRVKDLFLRLFPMMVQEQGDIRFNPPTLLGIWDRAPGFLHDGRARTLREAIASPDHRALRPGERGFNERFGMPDTHGGTSHLTADELADLVTFMNSL